MRAWPCAVLAAALVLPAPSRANEIPYDADLTKKIDSALKEIAKIKAGMTRAELLKIFTTEGGLSSRTWRRYVYKACPYIKVDVSFRALDGSKDPTRESPMDKITQISTPFLEYSINY